MQRLDTLLFEKGYFPSREKARRAVMAGVVEVEGRMVDKPGTAVASSSRLQVKAPKEPFVSRGGRKLEAALAHFGIDPNGWRCLDIGASTGGFTDCLLQKGAESVCAVDVGYGQLDQRLRSDQRVRVLERVNARYLDQEDLGETFNLITFDVSFISLVKVVSPAAALLAPSGLLLPLIKPQFEAGRGRVGKGGVVRDPELRRAVIGETVESLLSLGLRSLGIYDSPVLGPKGNQEAFALLSKETVNGRA